MRHPRVLAVDDEPALLRIIKDSLQDHFDVFLAENIKEAFASILDQKPDLILLDNIMPGLNGLEVVRTIRGAKNTAHIPIIMITALKESSDRIEAFKAGVDDFISKPFSPEELLTRVESRLQRQTSHKTQNLNATNIGNLAFDFENHHIRVDGELVHLTHIEMIVIEKLLAEQDQIVKRETLERLIWSDHVPDGRILDIHVATLRKKLKKFNHKIETIYGKGYSIRSQIK